MKNEEDGELIHFTSKQHYKSNAKKLWIYLQLKIFRLNGALYAVFCCDQCEVMEGVMKLRLDSSREDVDQLLCSHSKTAAFLLPNWRDIWHIDVPRFVAAYQPKINQDICYHKFQDRTKDTTLLTGIWVDDSPHLIVTVTKRQSSPFCSTCDSMIL